MPKSKGKSPKWQKPSAKRHNVKHTQKSSTGNVSMPKTSRAKRAISIAERLLAFWGVLLTIWVVYYPRVYVEPAVPLDPNNPAFTPFVVHNQGYFSIHDVRFSWSMKYITLPDGTLIIAEKEYENKFFDPKQVASVISAGEKYTVLLSLTGWKNNKIENADVAIVLSFKRIKWLPWRRETRHRFVSTQGKDNQWHWLPQPINE